MKDVEHPKDWLPLRTLLPCKYCGGYEWRKAIGRGRVTTALICLVPWCGAWWYRPLARRVKRRKRVVRRMVVHCKEEPYDVYIGRPSKWGNPFTIGKDGTREEVVEKHKEWVPKQSALLEDLHELKNKVLGCWCKSKKKPKRACHGDVLVVLARERSE